MRRPGVVAALLLLLSSLGHAAASPADNAAISFPVPPPSANAPCDNGARLPDNGALLSDNAALPPRCDLYGLLPDNSWIDRTHDYVARESLATVQRFDDFFGDRTRETIAPAESSLRWRNGFRFGTDRTFTYRTDLRASIRLKGLSRKLRLVISSETLEDALGINRDATGTQGVALGGTLQQSSTELRYEFHKSARSEADLGTGVRVKLPLVFYTRARYRYTLPVTDNSALRFQPTVFWRTHDGFGQSTALDYELRLGGETFFRWANSETSTERTAGVEWNSEPAILHALAPGKALTFAFGVNGATRPASRVTGYYVLTRYRQSVVRDWILVEAEPIQSWLKGDTGGYRPVSAITFRLELVFQGIRG